MTSTEIIEVIQACRNLGVRHFEGNGLKLEFGLPPEAAPQKVVGIEDPAAAQRAIDEGELRVKQELLDNLKLEDPYEYEQLIAQDLGSTPV